MAVKPVKTPFTNMSFTPDIPSAALSPSEYNIGHNVETDVRGINSVLGDEQILNAIPGNVIFTTAGFRNNDIYWFVVATREGKWYGLSTSGITELTPADANYVNTYNDAMPITDSWSGTTLIINDNINPPMFLTADAARFTLYNNDYSATTLNWNYNPDWSNLRAGFVRLYNSPNLGSLLIAGNLTADVISTGTTDNYPNTVRWSQNFGLNSGPTTWAPTLINTANELEVPVRGPVQDGFPLNGNFYVCSYWDTVVFSPIAYQSSTAPVFGIKLINQGRGLLNENCWANVDNTVFGLDARDIWSFDGGGFKPIGNQRVKNYFYDNLNPLYSNRVYMVNNTSKNQIEIYYTTLPPDIVNPVCVDTTGGFTCVGSDLKVNQQVRITGTLTGTGTISGYSSGTVYYITEVTGDPAGTFFRLSTTEGGAGVTTTPGTMTGLTFTVRLGDNGGVPNKMLSYRYDIDCWNAPRDVDSATFSTEAPIYNSATGTFNKGTRTVVYARGCTDQTLLQKDQGFQFLECVDGSPGTNNPVSINSQFRRDNIKILDKYTAKVMVHRVLPEVVNLGGVLNAGANIQVFDSTSTITVTIEGANSVGSNPTTSTTVTLFVDADGNNNKDPWAQIDQNAYRVTSLNMSSSSTSSVWFCSNLTWQYTAVEEDR